MRKCQLHDSRTATAGKHAILIALSFLADIPVLLDAEYIVQAARRYIFTSLLPQHWTFDNYVYAWKGIPMAHMLSNSLIVAVGQTLPNC